MRWIVGCLGLLGLFGVAFAGNTDVYTLKNGLTVLLRQDHRSPIVFASIWYKVGGAYEHDGITGVSHMLEHMMFRGTKKIGPGELNQIVLENGGQQNAMTGQDFTAYYQAWSKDKLPLSLKLEADRMRGLVLRQDFYNKEHQVVMEERRMRVDDNPQGQLYERFNAAAYVNSPYHHPVVGWMTDIKHLTLHDLKNWYQHWYTPNNAILVIVGDIDPVQVKRWVKQYFAKIPSASLPMVKPRGEIKALGLRTVTVRAKTKLPWLMMGYTVPSLPVLKQQHQATAWKAYALEVAAGILDAGESGRLSQDLIRGQQIAVSASAHYDPYSLYSRTFSLSAIPAPKHDLAALKQALLVEIKRLKTSRVSEDELHRVKAQVIAQNVYKNDSIQNQALALGTLMVVGLPWQESDTFVQHIQAVTPAQIEAVAQEYFHQDQLTIGLLKPNQTDQAVANKKTVTQQGVH
jgi:zinc protease